MLSLDMYSPLGEFTVRSLVCLFSGIGIVVLLDLRCFSSVF